MPFLRVVCSAFATAAVAAGMFLLGPQSENQACTNGSTLVTDNIDIMSKEDAQALRIIEETFRWVFNSPWPRIVSRLLTWDSMSLVLMAFGAITLALCMAWLILVAPLIIFHRYFGYKFEHHEFVMRGMIQDAMNQTAHLHQSVDFITQWILRNNAPMVDHFAREERFHRKVMRFFNAHPQRRPARTHGANATAHNNELYLILGDPPAAGTQAAAIDDTE